MVMVGWAGQLEQCCWQGLLTHVGTDCSCRLDKRTDWNVVGTIMINQQPSLYMIEHFVRKWWNNKIKQRCYNNIELGCCIKSVFVCSNISKQPLSSVDSPSCIQYVETWLNNTVIIPILFCHVNSNSLWYFYACRIHGYP